MAGKSSSDFICPNGTHTRNIEIDILRAIGIFFMIAGHIGFGDFFNTFIHGFHMPLFFIISGMFYKAPAKSKKDSTQNGILRNIFHMVKTLLLPYFFFGMMNYLIWLCFNWDKENYLGPLKALMWINNFNQYDNVMPYAGALWFLTAIFFTRLIYLLIDSYMKYNWMKHLAVTIISLFGCLADSFLPFELPWSFAPACAGVGFYACGVLVANLANSKNIKTDKCEGKAKNFDEILRLPVWATLIMGVAVTVSIELFPKLNMRVNYYGYIVPAYINAIVAVWVAYNISLWIRRAFLSVNFLKLIRKPVIYLGENTIVFLCLNQVVIKNLSFVQNEILEIQICTAVQKLISHLIIFLATVIILYLFTLLFTKTGLKFFTGKETAKPILIVVTVLIAAGAFLGAVVSHNRNEKSDIIVSKPIITADKLPCFEQNTDNEGETYERLKTVMRSNLEYITDIAWNDTNKYLVLPATSKHKNVEPDAEQKRQLKKSVESFRNYVEEDYLYIAASIGNSNSENAVRSWSQDCYTMANALFFGICDSEYKDEITEKTVLLISSLARNHCSNMGFGWGNEWQSALWAENIGYAAWLLWDELSEETKINVVKMIKYEADRFIDSEVPYFADKNGNVAYDGDTKGEENAWNSALLALASCMFPEDTHAEKWIVKMEEMLISSTARPSDCDSEETVDGYVLHDVLNGYNILENGTVINHSRYHIDYMSCIMEGMIDSVIIYKLAGRDIPLAALHNFDVLYEALVSVDLGEYDNSKEGHHFYENTNGNALKEVNMPGDNDWSTVGWYPSYYLNDTIIEVFNLDENISSGLKASEYAKLHLIVVEDMVKRNVDGRFFAEGENNFVSGEAYAMHNISKAYVLRRLFLKQ